MKSRIFAWDDRNREHLAKHDVSTQEAEEIVRNATPPYPMDVGDEKLLVWGQTAAGRYLQVVFVLRTPQEVDYESIPVERWMDIEGRDIEVIRVIHARDLTAAQKRRLRKQWS